LLRSWRPAKILKTAPPDTCGCLPGASGSPCALCPAGSFKSGHGAGACEAHPGGAGSLPGATSHHECLYAPGHRAQTGVCE